MSGARRQREPDFILFIHEPALYQEALLANVERGRYIHKWHTTELSEGKELSPGVRERKERDSMDLDRHSPDTPPSRGAVRVSGDASATRSAVAVLSSAYPQPLSPLYLPVSTLLGLLPSGSITFPLTRPHARAYAHGAGRKDRSLDPSRRREALGRETEPIKRKIEEIRD